MKINSPFIIKHDFISPLQCECIVDRVKQTGQKQVEDVELTNIVLHKIKDIQEEIEEKYDNVIVQIEHPQIYKMEQGEAPSIGCENSKFLRQKWVQIYNRDVTGVIFFSTTNMKPPFDVDYEIYGGKFEFHQHQFGFNSNRGVMVLYPSGPHFINAFTKSDIGDIYYAKFHITMQTRLIYQPNNFPGDYTTWFVNDL